MPESETVKWVCFYQLIMKTWCAFSKCQIHLESCRCHIQGVSDLGQVMSILLGLVLEVWEAHRLALIAALKQSAGMTHASLWSTSGCYHSNLSGEDTWICYTKCYTKPSMVWKNLSIDKNCTPLSGEIHPGSIQCCMKAGFPATEGW